MPFTKREPTQNMVFLGDGEGDRKSIGGLLIDIQQNRLYPEKVDYTIVTQNGEVLILAGSASLGRQLGSGDIGKFFKAAFTGWGKSGNGKFKMIEVNVWEGELTPAMKAWPRYAEFQAKPKATASTARPASPPATEHFDRPDDAFPTALEDEQDDGLPF